MNNKAYKSRVYFFMEMIRWMVVVLLLIITSVGSYMYRECGLFYRLVIISFMVVLSGYIALLTRHGKSLVVFSQEAYQEVRKVVWPTVRESLYTTLIVILVTIIISLVLWGLDSILVYMVSWSLRL